MRPYGDEREQSTSILVGPGKGFNKVAPSWACRRRICGRAAPLAPSVVVLSMRQAPGHRKRVGLAALGGPYGGISWNHARPFRRRALPFDRPPPDRPAGQRVCSPSRLVTGQTRSPAAHSRGTSRDTSRRQTQFARVGPSPQRTPIKNKKQGLTPRTQDVRRSPSFVACSTRATSSDGVLAHSLLQLPTPSPGTGEETGTQKYHRYQRL